MIRILALCGLSFFSQHAFSQQVMTPEMLIQLNRLSPIGMSSDGQQVIYKISKVDIASNASTSSLFAVPIGGGVPRKITDYKDYIPGDRLLSPDGKFKLYSEEVKLKAVFGTDYYPELEKSKVQIYNELNYRHWDSWEDGAYSHVFIENVITGERIDLMDNEPYDSPQKPFGGDEDFCWSPDGKSVLYVCKKKFGTEYAVSTNTDIYQYILETGKTINLTQGNLGYDTHPQYSPDGKTLAWLRMKRDGYESDKNDIVVVMQGMEMNLTGHWDGTVDGFMFSNDGRKIYFTAPVAGTVQLFEIPLPVPGKTNDLEKTGLPRQITNGFFDIRNLVGQSGNLLVVGRGDMNHATDLYTVDLKKGTMSQITDVNAETYSAISLSTVEMQLVPTTDGREMLTWVIYPPDFDPSKKYPTLLYCQGGPQGALSQFYSYRWNFQLMAAQGYIVVAPNRRGMPGHGVEWNEQISKDYGGQNMQDYLSAIDFVSQYDYVDKERLGCVGASYGGYSVFYLAAIHEGRFKSFISHDGIFNWKSMYGTTEELFFVNWDLGGSYWDKDNAAAQKSHTLFNPAERVENWDTPIMVIQGGIDYRVPIGQGLEAFQAAQLKGLKSRLLYFPEENHWVLDYQNSLIWHTEFYKWLSETLR
jgi:dipeptidyl aminopeptidase/acylaminoacyl peptidase